MPNCRAGSLISCARPGHDAVHTLDLPDANRTPDAEINRLAIQERRVVVTKDADFVNSFLLHRQPPQLLLVSTGNISNAELEALFTAALAQIVEAFSNAEYLNGAAANQPRKYLPHAVPDGHIQSFNGAAANQPRKSAALQIELREDDLLQRGRG